MTKPTRHEEFSVFRRFAPTIGLFAALVVAMAPAIARAQVNIDQGKPASELFESDCATCHKTARGLANGKNSLMLSSFLREHYTASRDQAAALAAYVLGAGGNAAAPPTSAQKPGQEHAKATGEEPKTDESNSGEPKTAEPKIGQPKVAEPKPGTHPTRQAAKPEATQPAQEPVVATPAANATPSSAGPSNQDVSPTTSAASGESQPGDSTPVPRDNIPD
jgi:hypothetical protein